VTEKENSIDMVEGDIRESYLTKDELDEIKLMKENKYRCEDCKLKHSCFDDGYCPYEGYEMC
jgi:hypothetical protein